MAYQIDSDTYTPGQTDWIDQPQAQSLAGETIKNRWKIHRWRFNVASVGAAYDNLFIALGTRVTLTTNDYADRNNQTNVVYPVAEVRSVTGSHDGPVMTNVVVEFLVRV